MTLTRHLGKATLLAVLAGSAATQLALAGSASAATVTKAQLKGTQLLVEGRTLPGTSYVSIESTTSAVGTRADANGNFKAQSSNFTAPDCRLTVRDYRSADTTVTIAGCTPSVTPPPANPAPPTGSCVITPQPTATALTAGTQSVFWFYATGCSPAGPLSYSVVAGAIPTGMTVGTYQNSSSGNILGTPSIRGTYRFTVQVTDAAGATDQETFTINVV